MQANDRVIKSYVWHGADCFLVSTLERDSSAAEGPMRFNETLVWSFVWQTAIRGDIIHQSEGPKGSITEHLRVCQMLHDYGIEQLRRNQ